MPVWIVEVFGSRELNLLFWSVTASTSPFWILMLFFPKSGMTRFFCRPWIAPPLLAIVYVYLLYLAEDLTGLPKVKGVEMSSVRRFWGHPILFIALWMHRMAMDLFVGIVMFRVGRYRLRMVSIELWLTWILGPVGMIVFALRYWFAEAFGSKRGP